MTDTWSPMCFVFIPTSYIHSGAMLLLKKTGLILYVVFTKLRRLSCPSVRAEELDSY